jgi:hypothetical protein
MFLAQRRASATQNDVRHSLLDRRIPAVHFVPTPFAFQPAFRSHDVFYVGNFRSDKLSFLVHNPGSLFH